METDILDTLYVRQKDKKNVLFKISFMLLLFFFALTNNQIALQVRYLDDTCRLSHAHTRLVCNPEASITLYLELNANNIKSTKARVCEVELMKL